MAKNTEKMRFGLAIVDSDHSAIDSDTVSYETIYGGGVVLKDLKTFKSLERVLAWIVNSYNSYKLSPYTTYLFVTDHQNREIINR